MHVITIENMKGGVGKTTLSLLLSTELALEGYRVAMFECDFNQFIEHHHDAGSHIR